MGAWGIKALERDEGLDVLDLSLIHIWRETFNPQIP